MIFNNFYTHKMVTKKVYESPLMEVIATYCYQDSICGVSNGNYTGEEGHYDPNSD